MFDAELFYQFIRHYTHKFSLVFIGDVQQLPPIQWGSFFNSMVKSRSINREQLTSIHRTLTEDGKKNGIIINSTKICQWPDGKMFVFDPAPNFIISHESVGAIKTIVQQLKNSGASADEVTIISPYRKRGKGTNMVKYLDQINTICQLIWNGSNPRVDLPDGRVFYVGDRVMLNKNNYSINVFNGQEGIVEGFIDNALKVAFTYTLYNDDKDDSSNKSKLYKDNNNNKNKDSSQYILEESILKTSDDGKKITMKKVVIVPFAPKLKIFRSRTNKGEDEDDVDFLDTDLLDISYAITIHKSQGSEWKYVIFYMPSDANLETGFLNRNMCYVAITRASFMIILLDPKSKIMSAIGKKLPYRCEVLTDRLKFRLPRLYEYEEKKIVYDGYSVNEDMPDDMFDDYD